MLETTASTTMEKTEGEIMATHHPLVERLIEINREHATAFTSPDAAQARRLYRAKHGTEILALKCMDGRVHLPHATETPLGIFQPCRNLGGQFNLGWPFFNRVIEDWVSYSISRGRDCLVFVTYHFSRSNERFGCAGFKYDTEAARVFTRGLKEQIESVFGAGHTVVYPIQVGFETDLDALVLHGSTGQTVDISTVTDTSVDAIRGLLTWLYPDMKLAIRDDLIPLVQGNIRHVAHVRESGRPALALEHREWVLAVGRGFDWLHRPNEALIVGPWSPNLDEPIQIAARIIKSNLENGRIDRNRGWVLMTSAPYREEAGSQPLLARAKSHFLHDFAEKAIREMDPELLKMSQPLVTIVNQNTRRFEVLNPER